MILPDMGTDAIRLGEFTQMSPLRDCVSGGAPVPNADALGFVDVAAPRLSDAAIEYVE
jgi:hypothetical protein